MYCIKKKSTVSPITTTNVVRQETHAVLYPSDEFSTKETLLKWLDSCLTQSLVCPSTACPILFKEHGYSGTWKYTSSLGGHWDEVCTSTKDLTCKEVRVLGASDPQIQVGRSSSTSTGWCKIMLKTNKLWWLLSEVTTSRKQIYGCMLILPRQLSELEQGTLLRNRKGLFHIYL